MASSNASTRNRHGQASRSQRKMVDNGEGDEPLKGTNGQVTVGDYRSMKVRFEMHHAWNRTADALIERDPRTGAIVMMSVDHAKRALSSEWSFVTGDGPDDCVPFFPKWLLDSERRTIKSIVNHDRGRPEEFYVPFKFAYEQFIEDHMHQANMENLDMDSIAQRFSKMGLEYTEFETFDGDDEPQRQFDVTATPEATERVMALFTRLVTMAAGDVTTDTYNYFLDYLAHIVQSPLVNPGVAIIFTGGKGVGKDTLCNFIANYVVGKSFSYCYMSSQQFFEKHDTNHMGKLFVKLEEADPAVMKAPSNAGVLRARITSEFSMANPKGQQAYQMPNYTRYFFTSNAVDPTGLNLDGRERRFLLLPFRDTLADTCAPGFCGTLDNDHCMFTEFWQPFNQHVMTPLGGFIVSMFLKQRDISGRVIFKLPYNPFLSVIAANDMTSDELFVEDWRADALEELERGGNAAEVSSKTLYERFKAWMALNQPENQIFTSHQFFQKIAKQVRDKKVSMSMKSGRRAFYSVQ